MSKRRSLTGGTGDVKPQILTLTTANGVAPDRYTIVEERLPVPRFGTVRNKSTIFEILKVWFYTSVVDVGDQDHTSWSFLTTSTNRNGGDISTLATFVVDLQNPRVFAITAQTSQILTNGASNKVYPVTIDLTDGAGNGILVATDSLFLVNAGSGETGATSAQCKILYRMVNVGITEYVGIVQSQQTG